MTETPGMLQNGAYLLTWNPQRWPWASIHDEAARLEQGETVRRWWSTGSRTNLPVGSRLFVVKLGEHPKGLVASGVAVQQITHREHFDSARRDSGDIVNSTMIEFDHIRVPANNDPVALPGNRFSLLASMDWTPQASGTRIPDELVSQLEIYWTESIGHESTSGKFVVHATYTRFDVLAMLGLPLVRGGPQFTGYFRHHDSVFIFATLGNEAGATGHNYPNTWDGEVLKWYTKDNVNASSPSVKHLFDPNTIVHVFTRKKQRDSFTYNGVASVADWEDGNPVCIHWSFAERVTEFERSHGEYSQRQIFIEGQMKTVVVNRRERDATARVECIKIHGVACCVCGMNFESVYGSIGRGFIHVHHLDPLGSVSVVERTPTNPEMDLCPVCPNCHAMLHRRDPPYSPAELREMLELL